MVFNVRQRQTEVLLKMLSLNGAAGTSGKEAEEAYKVLVLDRFCKDVIAPLLRVSDLRKHGVTLHLLLESERQPIPDVPAVYLVQPTPANIDRIVADATAGLYEASHVNFASSAPSRLIENMAAAMVAGKCVQRVAKVFDQYVSFVALEQSLFSLGLPNSYVELNDPTVKDFEIEAAVNAIVDGLFSVLVTLGVVPIIRCPRGGAAAHVAGLLDAKLRDALKPRSNVFSESTTTLGATLSRPLLCLFDRNFDLSAALQHSWTYKPLVQDVLSLRLNRVLLPDGGAGPLAAAAGGAASAAAKKGYDVDERDFFWEACGAFPFPRVAEEVETQLARYRAAVEEINKRTAAGAQDGGPAEGDHDEMLKRNTQHLMTAVSSLPELQERKKTLDKHTNMATALLGAIKGRALDQFFNLEEDLLLGKLDMAAVLKAVQGAKGSAADKLRLSLIYLLAYDGLPSEEDEAALERALQASGADVTALRYVRSLKRNNLTGSAKGDAAGAGIGSALGMASQTNLLDWADKTFGQGITSVTRSVKSLLGGARTAPMAAVLDALTEGRQGSPEFESYMVFDPKAPAGRAGLDRAKGPFRESIVFVVGGGNYAERETLQAWAARSQPTPRHVIYGATDILSGEEFVAHLAELGKRSGLGGGGGPQPTR